MRLKYGGVRKEMYSIARPGQSCICVEHVASLCLKQHQNIQDQTKSIDVTRKKFNIIDLTKPKMLYFFVSMSFMLKSGISKKITAQYYNRYL